MQLWWRVRGTVSLEVAAAVTLLEEAKRAAAARAKEVDWRP